MEILRSEGRKFMKLKLIISYDIPTDEDECYGADEDCYSTQSIASNAGIIRPEKEYSTISKIRRILYTHCRSSKSYRCDNVLIHVPDELMFQCMMDGTSDNDYIAYNIHSKKLVISDNSRLARRAVDINGSYYNYNKNSGIATKSHVNYNENENLILNWNLNSFNDYPSDKSYYIELQGDLYGKIYTEVKDYVIPVANNIISNVFISFASDISNITKINLQKENSHRTYYIEDECSSNHSTYKLDMIIDEAMLVLTQYINNGEYWQMVLSELTEYDIENIKRTFYLYDGMN